jgi:DNA-binding GntR family transcriptional regulator
VTWLSPEDLRERYEMMEGLEGVAVKLATERASDGLIDAIEAAIVDQERALEADDTTAWVAADARLHDLIVEGAANRQLSEWMRNVNGQMHRVRVFIAKLRRKPTQSTAEHREILAAMRARDAERARDLHMAHRARAAKEIIHILREFVSPAVRPSQA